MHAFAFLFVNMSCIFGSDFCCLRQLHLPPAEEKNENGDDKTGNTDSTRQKEQVTVLRIRRVDDL